MWQAANQFAADMRDGKQPYWLILTGQSGNGKTFLARGIFHWFVANVRSTVVSCAGNRVVRADGLWKKWEDVVERLYNGGYGIIEGLSEEWFAAIDDIGSEQDPKKLAPAALLKIQNRRERKWTVFTSNLSIQQMAESYDARIASRFLRNNSKVIHTETKDFGLR